MAEVLREQRGGFAGATDGAVPDDFGRGAVSAKAGCDVCHVGATDWAKRAGGVSIGGDRVTVANEMEEHRGKGRLECDGEGQADGGQKQGEGDAQTGKF